LDYLNLENKLALEISDEREIYRKAD